MIPLKPGVQTSEFWTVVVSGLILTAMSALSLTTYAYAAVGVTVLGLVYNVMRGSLKNIQAQAEADRLKTEADRLNAEAQKPD
jgi:dethiobiotin synthetase